MKDYAENRALCIDSALSGFVLMKSHMVCGFWVLVMVPNVGLDWSIECCLLCFSMTCFGALKSPAPLS